jgi:hypothetical protein
MTKEQVEKQVLYCLGYENQVDVEPPGLFFQAMVTAFFRLTDEQLEMYQHGINGIPQAILEWRRGGLQDKYNLHHIEVG